MRDTGVNGDVQIKTTDQGGSFDEIRQMRAQIDNIRPFEKDSPVVGPRLLLQAHEGRVGVEDV